MDAKQVVTTVIMFILMSVAMTTEKATLMWSLRSLRLPETDVITKFYILVILLGGPYLFSLFQIFWNVPFIADSKDKEFPGISNVILLDFFLNIRSIPLTLDIQAVLILSPFTTGLFGLLGRSNLFGILRSGSCTDLSGLLILTDSNSVLIIPILTEELLRFQRLSLQTIDIWGVTKWRSHHRKWLLIFVCMVASFLPSIMAAVLYFRSNITGSQAVALGMTLFGLSIVNSPAIQRYTLAPKGRLDNKPKKITLFYTILKLGSVLFFLTIHFVYRVPDWSDFTHLYNEVFPKLLTREVGLPLTLNYISAIIAHGLAFVAITWCLPVYGIVLPSILSVISAIGICYVIMKPVLVSSPTMWQLNSMVITSLVILIIWGTPYLLSSTYWTKKPEYLFMPFESLFISYGWNALFFDQYLLLGYRREGRGIGYETNAELIDQATPQRKSHIFVCTTMYREADYEMERLLLSLQNLSFSRKFKNVLLEAHVFMDNGCAGKTLNAFAQQLVELVRIKLGLNVQNGACVEMPYGIQITWTLNGGMPLIVHFKDSQKIKAKKRWSQAMYIHYILNFRLGTPTLKDKLFWSDTSGSTSIDNERKVTNVMSTDFSHESIKKNALGLGRYTKVENHTKGNGERRNKLTDLFLVSNRDLDLNISRIGYPTLVSHKWLEFDRGSNERVMENQNSSLRVQGESFLKRLISRSDSAPTQTSDSFELSLSSTPTASADDESDGDGSQEEMTSLCTSVSLSFVNETFLGDNNKNIKKQQQESISEEILMPDDSENLRKYNNIQESLNKQSTDNTMVNQGFDSNTKTTKSDDVIPFKGENIVLHRTPLLELRVDNCSYADSTEKTNMAPHFQSLGDVAFDAISEEQVYILATDADMEFKDDAVIELLQMCNGDRRIGAACGRTHPQGKRNRPIVWHQIFEYAKDFWMIKNAQNVIGSVMCCPGCFSLYRASAVRQVMDKYVSPTRTPFTVYVKDTGEDRWLATLLMIQGWYMRYSCFARNNTFCPDTFEEFLKQRRRWVLSDIANAVLVVQNLWSLMRSNACFSLCYVLYMLNMFLNNIITPGTAIVMITAGLDLVFEVPYLYTTVPLTFVVFVYSIACTRCSSRVQTHMTAVLTLIMGAIFFAVVVWGSATIVRGIVQDIMIGQFHFQQHYVIMLITLSFGYAAAMHPSEAYMVIYGLVYVFIFPAMHILLPIYSIANSIDQSWGTRDAQKAKLPKVPSIFRCIRRKKKKISSKISGAKEEGSSSIVGELECLKGGGTQYDAEYNFWLRLRQSIIGNDVNTGLGKAELAKQLRRMRNRSLTGILIINGLWLLMLSVFYMGISSSLSRLNIYGVISGALYGFTLVIQMLGITACRLNHLIRYLGKNVFRNQKPYWINCK